MLPSQDYDIFLSLQYELKHLKTKKKEPEKFNRTSALSFAQKNDRRTLSSKPSTMELYYICRVGEDLCILIFSANSLLTPAFDTSAKRKICCLKTKKNITNSLGNG
jgi:hypothetical protein